VEWFVQLSDEIMWDVTDRETGRPRARVLMKAGDVAAMPADIRHQGFSKKRSMLLVWENARGSAKPTSAAAQALTGGLLRLPLPFKGKPGGYHGDTPGPSALFSLEGEGTVPPRQPEMRRRPLNNCSSTASSSMPRRAGAFPSSILTTTRSSPR
jgi:hypothetical protein